MPLNKPLIAIVGPSGSGKSTSLRNVDPTTTRVIDIERKGFPFLLNDAWQKAIVQVDTPQLFEHELVKALKDPTITLIINESFTKFAERLLVQSKAICKGYDIYNNYNGELKRILELCKNPNKIVVWTAIDEIVKIPQQNGTETSARRIYVGGRELEGKIEQEFLCVLYTEPKREQGSTKVTYNFITNSDTVNSAKTPMYLDLPLYIPNDLNEVIKKIK